MDPGPNKTMLLFLFTALLRLSSAYIQPEGNGRVLDERLAEYQRVASALSPLNLRNNICLLSRLKYYPCTFRQPSTTKVPGLNEYGTYTTKFRGNNCEILRKKHRVGAIPVINKFTEPVFTTFSPGFFQSPKQNYGNNQLSYYNISCRKGQFIFFNMTDLGMQNSSCVDPIDNKKKCVDYVQLRLNNGLLVSENCGSDTTGVKEQILPFDSLKMVFRSNSAYRFPGFSASVVCFDPGNFRKGCSQTFIQGSQLNLGHGSQRIQGSQLGSPTVIQVRADVDVQKQGYRIHLVSRETRRYADLSIKILYTFSLSGELQEFPAESVPTPGPGVLFLSNDRAYYQKFVSVKIENRSMGTSADQWFDKLATESFMGSHTGSTSPHLFEGGSSSATEVPYGVDVTYRSHILDFVERETGRIMLEKRLVDVTINILYTFSMSGEVEEFRSWIPNRLQGPGVLFRSNDRAYFQKFLVDTTALQPNAIELQLIANFNKANRRLVPRTPVEDPTLLPTEPPTQRCIEVEPITLPPRFTLRPLITPPPRFIPGQPITLPPRFLSRQRRTISRLPRFCLARCIGIEPITLPPRFLSRQKRTSSSLCLTALPQRKKRLVKLSQGTFSLSDKVLAQSIRNKDACNPILKASATSLMNQLKIENSDRLNLLIAALPDMDVLTAASRT